MTEKAAFARHFGKNLIRELRRGSGHDILYQPEEVNALV